MSGRSGRRKGEQSRDNYQQVWFYLRAGGYSQRAIARKLGLSVGTVSYYKRLGLPDYDERYHPEREIPDDLLTEGERLAKESRTKNVQKGQRARRRGTAKLNVIRTPDPDDPPPVTSIDARRRKREA